MLTNCVRRFWFSDCVEIAADLATGGYAAPMLAEPVRVAPTASFLSIHRGYSFRL